MDQHEFVVDSDPGSRLDAWLAKALPALSRTRIQQLIKQGQVTINGKPKTRPRAAVHRGDQLLVAIPDTVPTALQPEDIPLDVLYEDEQLIVLNKPAGLVVHPAAGNEHGTLVHALLHHCRELPGIGGEERPGIVHRLDKDTSGVIVVAKTEPALHHLQAQFKQRSARKTYRALVWGIPARPEGTIHAPIGRHPVHRKKMAVVEHGREAITHYRVQESIQETFALLELSIETGRTHQIRVHLAQLGHPIVGDPLYGDKRRQHPAKRQMLHAESLTIQHPATAESMTFEAPLPPDFIAALSPPPG